MVITVVRGCFQSHPLLAPKLFPGLKLVGLTQQVGEHFPSLSTLRVRVGGRGLPVTHACSCFSCSCIQILHKRPFSGGQGFFFVGEGDANGVRGACFPQAGSVSRQMSTGLLMAFLIQSQFNFYSFIYSFNFEERVLLCSAGWPGMRCVGKAGSKLTEPVSAFGVWN